MISVKLAIRNLARNRWRTGLTFAAVAVAVALMVWTLALYEGWLAQMIRGATAVQTAQIQIHTASYAAKPRIYRSFTAEDELLTIIGNLPDVVAFSPRIKAHGLLGNEARSQVVQILGVDPDREAATTPVATALVSGRWLDIAPPEYPAPREIVLGQGVARQLKVDVGDELVAFLEAADGSLGNDLFEVVGIIRTGNTQVDRMSVYVNLEDARYITALEGQVHEISIQTADLTRARETAREIVTAAGLQLGTANDGPVVDGDALVVRSWQVIHPSVSQLITLFRRSYWIMYLIIYLVAAIGILNTQRMSALERRREFAVLMAIGMRPRRMLRTLEVETLVVGFVGAMIGATGGGLLAWYHATAGFDLGLLTSSAAFTYMGVAFSQRLFFVLEPHMLIQ
ncbi:MAG: ABC transporter permease, partial [Gemmatimonadetes bacterium]|nr:ABC transporter permease [Gemmatimonadota bacterium]